MELPHCASGHNAIFITDIEAKERRFATVKDVEDFARISDHLKSIDIVGVPLNPQDVPRKATLLYAVKALYENTTKPLFFSTESREVNAAIIKMMKAVAGKEDIAACPNAVCQLSPTSPLYWEQGAAEGVMDAALNGVPLNILPEPMSGVSAPYSVAGLLTVHNTEVLSGNRDCRNDQRGRAGSLRQLVDDIRYEGICRHYRKPGNTSSSRGRLPDGAFL